MADLRITKKKYIVKKPKNKPSVKKDVDITIKPYEKTSNIDDDLYILDNVYVPSYCLQGATFSSYMTWENQKNLKIEIEIPEYFQIEDIDNSEDYTIHNDKIIKILKINYNGFLCFTLKTKISEKASLDAEIIMRITHNERSEIIIKKIHIFRPDLKVIGDIPNIVRVNCNSTNSLEIVGSIQVSNFGEGIGVIGFDTLNESELDLELPRDAGKFFENFNIDFSDGLEKLKKKNDKYSEIIDEIVNISRNPPLEYNQNVVKVYEELSNKLEDAFSNDKNFFEAWLNCMIVAYRKNINILLDVDTFVKHLHSVESSKIFIKGSIAVLNINNTPKTLKADLTISDLGENFYPSIPLEITFYSDSNTNIELPIYRLFKIINNEEIIT